MSKNVTDASIKKRILILCLIAGFLFVSSIAFVLIKKIMSAEAAGSKTAYIYSDGRLVDQIDLETADDTTFIIESPAGGSNTVMVSDHDICVKEADCPNGLCIKQGFAGNSHIPIVCLPNKLVIVVKDNKGGKEESYDTITY